MKRLYSIMLCAALLASSLTAEKTAPGRWYQPITVNNKANPATLTDYSVLVKVNTAALIAQSLMKADGADIRFTTDSTDDLSYWIDPGIQSEHGINRDSTHIWVKMPVIPGSASKTIYMFYGNSAATAKSRIDSAFIFGDDFDDNKLDTAKWATKYDAQGKIVEQNQRLEHASPATSPESHSTLFSKQQFTGPLVLEMQFKKGGYVYRSLGLTPEAAPATNYAYCQWQDWGSFSAGVMAHGVQGDVNFRNDSWSTANNPEYYITMIRREDGTFSFSEQIPSTEPGGPQFWTGTVTDRTMPLDSAFKIFTYDGVWVYGGGSTPRYEDNIRVRKYSNPEPFTVVSGQAVPSIISFSPASGTVGTSVKIIGSNFGAQQGASTVMFGGVTATVTTWSDTSIRVPVPASASGSVTISVVVNGMTVNSATKFTVNGAQPAIDVAASMNFGSIDVGTTLQKTLTVGNTGTAALTGTVAVPTSSGYTLSSTALNVAAGGTQNFTVTFAPLEARNYNSLLSITHNASGSPTNVQLSGVGVAVPPQIMTFSPSHGVVGTNVTIAGTGFGSVQGASIVQFDAVTATPTSWSDTQIIVPVPSGVSGPVTIYVTVNGTSVNSGTVFTVDPAPAPVISIPSSIAFGSVAAGTSSQKTFTVGNTGSATLTGTLSVPANSGYTLSSTALSVAARDSQKFTVTFSPLAAQDYNSLITITHNAGALPSMVALSGTGQVTGTAPTIAVSPSSILVMKNGTSGTLSSVSINVSNNGQQTLTGSVSYSGTSILKLASGSTLTVAGGTSSAITLQQNNTQTLATGSYMGMITITHNAPGGTTTIPVEVRIVSVPQSITLSKSVTFTNPDDPMGYQLLSVPGNQMQAAATLLAGEYTTDWRLYRDNGAVSDYLVEYDGSPAFMFGAGKGFWVLTRKGFSVQGTVSNATSSSGAYGIALQVGWNIIADPYERGVNWSDVKTYNSLPSNAVIYGWTNGAWFKDVSLLPFKAYYYYNTGNAAMLYIPYDPSGVLGKTAATENTVEAAPYVSSRAIRLSLSSNGASVATVAAAFDSTSCTDFDANDCFAPPAAFALAGLTIENDAPHMPVKHLAIDHRKDVGAGQVFDLTLQNKTGGVCTLDAEGMQTVAEAEIYLKNTVTGMSYNLRKQSKISVAPSAEEQHYQLVVGSKQYLETNGVSTAPVSCTFPQNYPNPFNPSTTVRYGLPASSRVTIRIYNLLGQEVSTLVNGVQAEGWHEAVWNAGAMAAGVYFCRIEAVDAANPHARFTRVQKMLLVK